jgi:coenzyme F420 hydrogenase subunit beta
MTNQNNIKSVVDNALCTGCGACSGVCPAIAINMKYNIAGYLHAYIDGKKCTQCGKCTKVCPSEPKNLKWIDDKNMFYGKYIEGYVGYASDPNVRLHSQSGGLVTALLNHLLERKEIDGAIVTHFDSSTKRPETSFESTTEGIKRAVGSYYTQTSVVENCLKHQDKKNVAVVLGCHAQSLFHIRNNYKEIKTPEILIGLFCAGQHSGNLIDKLLEKGNISNSDVVTGFRFRDKTAGGWPGNIKIYCSAKSITLNSKIRQNLKEVYAVPRCLLCFDQMCIYSDIAVGDPWGIPGKQDVDGHTVVIVRTQKGKELIEEAIKYNKIIVDKIPIQSIMMGQTVDSRLRPQFYAALNYANKRLDKKPYHVDLSNDISKNDVELEKKVGVLLRRRIKLYKTKRLLNYRLKIIIYLLFNYYNVFFRKVLLKLKYIKSRNYFSRKI